MEIEMIYWRNMIAPIKPLHMNDHLERTFPREFPDRDQSGLVEFRRVSRWGVKQATAIGAAQNVEDRQVVGFLYNGGRFAPAVPEMPVSRKATASVRQTFRSPLAFAAASFARCQSSKATARTFGISRSRSMTRREQ